MKSLTVTLKRYEWNVVAMGFVPFALIMLAALNSNASFEENGTSGFFIIFGLHWFLLWETKYVQESIVGSHFSFITSAVGFNPVAKKWNRWYFGLLATLFTSIILAVSPAWKWAIATSALGTVIAIYLWYLEIFGYQIEYKKAYETLFLAVRKMALNKPVAADWGSLIKSTGKLVVRVWGGSKKKGYNDVHFVLYATTGTTLVVVAHNDSNAVWKLGGKLSIDELDLVRGANFYNYSANVFTATLFRKVAEKEYQLRKA